MCLSCALKTAIPQERRAGASPDLKTLLRRVVSLSGRLDASEIGVPRRERGWSSLLEFS